MIVVFDNDHDEWHSMHAHNFMYNIFVGNDWMVNWMIG